MMAICGNTVISDIMAKEHYDFLHNGAWIAEGLSSWGGIWKHCELLHNGGVCQFKKCVGDTRHERDISYTDG